MKVTIMPSKRHLFLSNPDALLQNFLLYWQQFHSILTNFYWITSPHKLSLSLCTFPNHHLCFHPPRSQSYSQMPLCDSVDARIMINFISMNTIFPWCSISLIRSWDTNVQANKEKALPQESVTNDKVYWVWYPSQNWETIWLRLNTTASPILVFVVDIKTRKSIADFTCYFHIQVRKFDIIKHSAFPSYLLMMLFIAHPHLSFLSCSIEWYAATPKKTRISILA